MVVSLLHQINKHMRNPIRLLALTALVVAVGFTSCKKDEQDSELDSQFRQFNQDSQNYTSDNDQIDSDVNNTVSDAGMFGRYAGVQSSPLCGVTIDSSQLAQKILYFNFDGVTPCFHPSRTRSGQIKVELTSGAYWSDVNAVLTITFINFKVTRMYDNKSITFNGVKTLTNINGNDWIGFFAGTKTLKYRSRALNLQVSFDNGANATWNHVRVNEWSYDASGPGGFPKYDFTSSGDTTVNGFTNVDSWGVNRYGNTFTTYYTNPWASNSYCGFWRPVSGYYTHNVNSSNFVLQLGVDQNGNPSTLDCAYGFKVTWSANGNTYVRILSY